MFILCVDTNRIIGTRMIAWTGHRVCTSSSTGLSAFASWPSDLTAFFVTFSQACRSHYIVIPQIKLFHKLTLQHTIDSIFVSSILSRSPLLSFLPSSFFLSLFFFSAFSTEHARTRAKVCLSKSFDPMTAVYELLLFRPLNWLSDHSIACCSVQYVSLETSKSNFPLFSEPMWKCIVTIWHPHSGFTYSCVKEHRFKSKFLASNVSQFTELLWNIICFVTP